jgi:hypothetical protein
MLSRRLTFGAALGALVVSLQTTAQAQYYNGCGGCGPVVAQPIAQCTPIQPIQQTCYQTVPITTYKREKQTVQVPTYETAYEDREYTEYRPVTRTREIEVPTVSYQNVTECRTVNRDMGRWTTNYHPIAKCAPCQVDPRPGLIGWMNRTGYSMRTAFMPNYTTSRQYVPNVVAYSVPYTRQVAVRGTRKVAVQETEMVAERKTQKVQVQKLVMKSQEVEVMRAQTAYRTVPIGTAMAYGSPFIGGSQMAYGYPIIENSSPRAALGPTPDPISSERSTFKEDSADPDKSFKRATGDDGNVNGAGFDSPLRGDDDTPEFGAPQTRRAPKKSDDLVIPAVFRKESAPETAAAKPVATKSSGWRASRKSSERSISGSSLDRPSISMADSTREK